MKKTIISLLVSMVCVVSAQDAQKAPISFALTTGAIVPVILDGGDILGTYIYIGPSVVIPMNDKLSLVLGLGIEAMPKQGNYGAVASVTGDYLVRDWIGIDVAFIAAHDEDKTLREILGRSSTLYLSMGLGTSIFFSNGIVISPMITYDWSIDGLGNSVSPVLLASIPFP